MSASDGFQRGSQAPAGLSLNLSSNNPFRNHAASPASPFDDPPSRPTSRNPFLDNPPPPLKSPGAMSNNSTQSLSAEEIFNSLTLDDKKPAEQKTAAPPAYQRVAPGSSARRAENVPPPADNKYRPTGSQEEALRARKMAPSGQRPGGSKSPVRKPPPQRRPRRNSESSVMDFELTEEEKRMIARRRERERQKREARGRTDSESAEKSETRDKSEKPEKREGREGREGRELREPRDGKQRSKSGRPNRRVDIIDQLDATGVYGTGLFHHDGPFDALNPHRNRGKSRRDPMQAFPKDSLNNSLGGSGPLNKQPNHAAFMMQGDEEAFRDYSYGTSKVKDSDGKAPIFNPIARGDVIHGDQSIGLGTSTFLEGTPATRTAIQRDVQDQVQSQSIEGGGLQRKKSLAQRLRGYNRTPRDYPGRTTTPDAYGPKEATSADAVDGNPFFAEYGKGEESISVRPREGAMSPISPPRRRTSGAALERRATADGALPSDEPAKPSGFLGRMKSLKGGGRRPSRTNDGPTSPPGHAV